MLFLIFIATKSESSTFRVLVAVTPAAANGMGSSWRQEVVARAVTIPNQIYYGSFTPETIQIAGIVLVNYTEVDETTDLGRLMTNGDGYMDTIFTLRNNYAADMVTLYGNYPNEAGMTFVVGADQSNAFYVVYWYRASSQRSASHEMGHLFGAAHDTAHPVVPLLPYGYGFWATYNGADWGTIMSYFGVGDRQDFYSNPDSLFRGVHRGTVSKCNVTRLLTERGPTIAGFRNPGSNITIANRTLKAQEYGDVMSNDSIIVNGPDTVRDTADFRLRANQKVVINSGFVIGQYASLTIRAGTGALLGKRRQIVQEPPPELKPTASINSQLKFGLHAYLNNGIIRVRYSMPEEGNVVISLFDLSGRLVLKKPLGIRNAGQYVENIYLSQIKSDKIYLVKMSTEKVSLIGKVLNGR